MSMLSSIGLGEVMYGAFSLSTVAPPVANAFAWGMLGLGLPTFVGSLLLGWRMELGYRIGVFCAALQLPLLPMGTGFGIWSLISMPRAKAAVSAEHLDALRQSPTEIQRPHLRFLLLGVLVIHLFGANLMILDLALFFLINP